MTSRTEAIAALIASSRGARPQSLASQEAEEVLNISLALAVELAVSNDRIDRLERLVAELREEDVETLRDIRYDGAIAREREDATEALLMRSLRVILDPRTAKDAGTPTG